MNINLILFEIFGVIQIACYVLFKFDDANISSTPKPYSESIRLLSLTFVCSRL
jgi:hypothetical protein